MLAKSSIASFLDAIKMSQQRSTSQTRQPGRARSRSPISRPTTPLRPSSRSSFRNSQNNNGVYTSSATALDALEPQFAELSDSMADLEANFMHLQLMHESLSRFGESFASFLYGLNMNAFVVDFPEVRPYVRNARLNKLTRTTATCYRVYQTTRETTGAARSRRHIYGPSE